MTTAHAVVEFHHDLLRRLRAGTADPEGSLVRLDQLGEQLQAERREARAVVDGERGFALDAAKLWHMSVFAASVLHNCLRAALAARMAGDDEAAEAAYDLASVVGRLAGEFYDAVEREDEAGAREAIKEILRLQEG